MHEILNEGVPQLVIEKNGEELYVDVTLDGKKIAEFTFDHIGNDLSAQDMFVIPEHRGKDISKWVYDSLKSKGYTVNRSTIQTDDGAHFWDKNKGSGSKVWEQDVAESDVVKFKQKPLD
jgi:GNAT superfamily N-acetyltransferase